MKAFRRELVLLTAALLPCIEGCSSRHAATNGPTTEARAVQYLAREVPAWLRENACFSCHNNGDGARALATAAKMGFRISDAALEDTIGWVSKPARWEHNKGDPGFSDQRLANIQFAASLLAAIESGRTQERNALREAAIKVAADQHTDGAWHIEPQNPVGSPTTYGTPLATFMAWRVLKESHEPRVADAMHRAESWLRELRPQNVPSAAVIVLFGNHEGSSNALEFLRSAQTSDGGWGPFKDSPAEGFDTALALLALSEGTDGWMKASIARGREFLARQQLADGSWLPTTRPSGGISYAQKMSTTGWATIALLRTVGLASRTRR